MQLKTEGDMDQESFKVSRIIDFIYSVFLRAGNGRVTYFFIRVFGLFMFFSISSIIAIVLFFFQFELINSLFIGFVFSIFITFLKILYPGYNYLPFVDRYSPAKIQVLFFSLMLTAPALYFLCILVYIW